MILKNIFDYLLAFLLIVILFIPTIIILIIVYKEDFKNPIYFSKRVKKNNKIFSLLKIRSMKILNQKNVVTSTSYNDPRISKIGSIIRRYKIDEIPQLINIINNEMSFVGPRPNVVEEVKLYTNHEKKLLNVKPGITDYASIIFSDESEILKNSSNPNLDYNLLIRPWKSLIGIYYVENRSFFMDIEILFLTLFSLFDRVLVTRYISKKLLKYDFETYSKLFTPTRELKPLPPPGSNKLVSQSDLDGVYNN